MLAPAAYAFRTRARADGARRHLSLCSEFVHVQPDASTYSRSYAVANSRPNPIAHTEPNTRAYFRPHAVADSSPYAIAHTEPNARAYARPHADPDPWPHTEVRLCHDCWLLSFGELRWYRL
jgi:hypothetical protein